LLLLVGGAGINVLMEIFRVYGLWVSVLDYLNVFIEPLRLHLLLNFCFDIIS